MKCTTHFTGCDCHEFEWDRKLGEQTNLVYHLTKALKHIAKSNRHIYDLYDSAAAQIDYLHVAQEVLTRLGIKYDE